jgi:hypothetical protein
VELSWTTEQEKLFAQIQASEGCTRIQAIHAYKRRSRNGVYKPPVLAPQSAQLDLSDMLDAA